MVLGDNFYRRCFYTRTDKGFLKGFKISSVTENMKCNFFTIKN